MFGFLRRLAPRRIPTFRAYRARLSGKRGLEIGGPSAVFAAEGVVPIYPIVGSMDGVTFAHDTLWRDGITEGRSYGYGGRVGQQYVCDATALTRIADSAYDFVCASHVLEHVANPLRALEEWKRVTREHATFALVVPHKDGTFDHRRPVTSLAHLVDDYTRGVGEDDLSHLEEWLSLIDLSRAPEEKSREAFRARALRNHEHRGMHHHVFDTETAVKMIDHAGLQIVAVDPSAPLNVFLLAEKADRPDNTVFLGRSAPYRRESPFPSDREGGSTPRS